jgi:CheY-like chemotaxis protein
MPTILIVDDDRAIRCLLENCLRNAGHSVLVACNGRQALELSRDHSVDLVLMDMSMPEVDGWTASRMIKDVIGNRIQIIAVTAYSLPGDRARAVSAGCTKFVSKPIDINILSQTIVEASEMRAGVDETEI